MMHYKLLWELQNRAGQREYKSLNSGASTGGASTTFCRSPATEPGTFCIQLHILGLSLGRLWSNAWI